MIQVWFGILGIAAGATVMFSGVLADDKAEAASDGVTITIVHRAPTR